MPEASPKTFLVGYWGNQMFSLTKREASIMERARKSGKDSVTFDRFSLSTNYLWLCAKHESNVILRYKGSNETLDEHSERKELGEAEFRFSEDNLLDSGEKLS